jgi:hypothetical protein
MHESLPNVDGNLAGSRSTLKRVITVDGQRKSLGHLKMPHAFLDISRVKALQKTA